MKNCLLLIVLFIIFSAQSFFAQQARLNPFQIKNSTLIEELISHKAANSNQSVEDFVKSANEMLQAKGINYVFGFDAATCQKIEQAKTAQKDKTAPLNLRVSLNSVEGDRTPLILPDAKFEKRECLPCYMELPVFEMTEKDFVTSLLGRNIKFFMPTNFVVQEMQLVEVKDLTTVKKRWKIPFRTTPLSISFDGNVVYLAFNEPELNDLALMIFSEGVTQICAKKDISKEIKTVPIKDFPADENNPNLAFINFSEGDSSQTIKFSKPCNN